jgi:exopolysaccharide biosynthesis polyprenyl glycosylphosphotransferase
LVGSARNVESFVNLLERRPEAGKKVVGALVLDHPEDLPVNIAPFVGELGDVIDTLETLRADTVILTANDALDPMLVRHLSWSLDPSRHQLMLVPGISDLGGPRISLRPLPEMHLIQIDILEPPLARKFVKRCFDVIGAGVLLLLSLPTLAIAGALIWREDRGPIFFKQHRIGLYGASFRIFKLRTMAINAEAKLPVLLPKNEMADGVLFKLREDPRVTRVGRFLRRWSIDELPQLVNVVRGSMSLVGPRPHLPSEVAKFEEHAHRRFLVKPGITGPWQVSGRSNLNWEEAVKLDLHYVENWSIIGDLRILFRTVRAVVKAEGSF